MDGRKGKPESPPVKSPPKKVPSPPVKAASPPVKVASPPLKAPSPPKTSAPKAAATKAMPLPDVTTTQPKRIAVAPPKRESSLENPPTFPPKTDFNQKKETSPPKNQMPPQPKNQVTSPPMSTAKLNRSDSKGEENPQPLKVLKKEPSFTKETVIKSEKFSLVSEDVTKSENKNDDTEKPVANSVEKQKSEESNGVGDKIKKFEKAAEDASANATVGRLSRPGSVRGRGRSERLGSDELPPPATPFKDSVHFELAPAGPPADRPARGLERQHSLGKPGGHAGAAAAKWQRSETSSVDADKVKPEPQKIIKPEFKPLPSPLDVTIRSPSLGAKLPDQFPSHGTAFRNVASPDAARAQKPADDVNTLNNFKPCKFKNKEKYSVSKGSSYFTRGSEEIWLVKKKDIEEIEERVLDSFRRAGGNVCMRSESLRPASEGGQAGAATLGRGKRAAYARSESLDPQWAGARAHTLKRQSSVACTCGHDKKPRARAADAPRARSRSHGDDHNHAHVLDKYETLV